MKTPSAGEPIDNRYRLFDIIGQGGAGIVYRFVDRLNGRTLALKRIKPSHVTRELDFAGDGARLVPAQEF